MGQPPKIVSDPGIIDRIVNLIRAGNFPEVAAVASGMDRATFYRAMQRGNEHKCGLDTDEGAAMDMCNDEDERHIYRDFRDAIKRAKAEGEVSLVLVLKNAARGAESKIHNAKCPIKMGLDYYPDDYPNEEKRGRRVERNAIGLPDCNCTVITKAPDPYIAARMLESFGKDRWLRIERIEHTGEGGGPVEVTSPAEEINAEADRVAKRLLMQMPVKPEVVDGNGHADGQT